MSGCVGMVLPDIVSAAELGLALARRGSAVRVFAAGTPPALLEQALRLGPTDAVLLAADPPDRPGGAPGVGLERLRPVLAEWCERLLAEPSEAAALDAPGLRRSGALDRLASVQGPGGHGVLAIAGADNPVALAQVEAAAAAGALLLTLPREAVLDVNESFLMGISAGAATALKQGRAVVIRSENWTGAAEVTRRLGARRGIPGWEVESRVRTLLARAALQALNATGARALVAVGGSTAGAALGALQLGELIPVAGAPGDGAWLVAAGEHPVLLGVRRGSGGDAQGLIRALAAGRELLGL